MGVTLPTVASYQNRLAIVNSSTTMTQYKKQCKEMGICGPSLFSALPKSLPCPKLFPPDLMHLIYNTGQLMLQLFWGTIDHNKVSNKPSNWDFAILYHSDDFATFGKAVEHASHFILTCVEDCASCNPAEKINSGYKALEYHILIFRLCTGLFYGQMPPYLYCHFCPLGSAICIIHRRHKSKQDLLGACKNLAEFVVLYEHYYYQHKMNHLQFVRPCIHLLLHLIDKTFRVGSLTELSQWTMERTISNYEHRIQLDTNPYGNLGQEIIEQAMVNALFAMDSLLRYHDINWKRP
ncbi:hypothetical protein E1B28_000059 [Marasmius oreades]|uniref:Uncharacterized protein n=1 Tax=Marasmius oreades TaxID=181124 RepID=A0A9P8AE80_9AGAR|nr:uncharacterized protein E1B28_000059 [Marasmius oreades]KAG7098085.1 hypothetical protein E1B28_000059 [Marasmius oreades]